MYNYIETYRARYIAADTETRRASKEYWLKCHKANKALEDKTAYNFSALILACIMEIEETLKSCDILDISPDKIGDYLPR